MFEKEVYIERRKKLCEKMKNGIGVFMGNMNSPIDYSDNSYDFIQDSTFLYYFGLSRENLVGIIEFSTGTTHISGVDFTLDDMIWMGGQSSILEDSKKYGIESFLPYSKLEYFLLDKSEGTESDDEDYFQQLLYITPYRDNVALELARILGIDYEELKDYSSLALKKAIIEFRNIKTTEEIKEIEKAVNVTRLMHLKAMEIVKAGMKEYEIVAEVEAVAKKFNCVTSFKTICSVQGEILHNHNYSNELKEGEILVLDCGAKTESGYCGDMTSIIPVSGYFNEKQEKIYKTIVSMFDAAIENLKINVDYREAYKAASYKLIESMIELNIFKGDINKIFEAGAQFILMPHGLGHLLGMNVHDMENYGEDLVGYDEDAPRDKRIGHKSARLGRKLKEGYTFTVEPGIYFIPRLIEDCKKKNLFKDYVNYEEIEKYSNFGGMRFERDFAMVNGEAKVLGEKMPHTVEELICIMKKS
ncbi:MAG: aminopeptidase P N-terminal domain-containing protein [Fusobacteriaceae bacterium]